MSWFPDSLWGAFSFILEVALFWVVLCATLLLKVALFWSKKLGGLRRKRNETHEWLEVLQNAETFEDWKEAALNQDNKKKLQLWRNNPVSRSYDWELIGDRLEALATAREENDLQSLLDLVRSGLVRNLGNITVPRLYNESFAGTKYLIEEYVAQVAGTIEDINLWLTPVEVEPEHRGVTFSTQHKLDFLHDTRQALGRSTLVLQGGAIFRLCHLGVVRALFLQGLLPRIITGTATWALIASLVAIHTEDELPRVLNGDGIDLSAFEIHAHHGHQTGIQSIEDGWQTLWRRIRRFVKHGYLLDVKVLEECVRSNVGDLTFEEAYDRSKRILNITVATEGRGGVPTLLNHITAPNVLIRTAAVASNASTPALYGSQGTMVLCKDVDGNIVPWAPDDVFHHYTLSTSNKNRNNPLLRISQLFNVNHFIISQARPYMIPFLQSDMHGPSLYATTHKFVQITRYCIRMMGLELRHRLGQLDELRLLPASVRRLLIDEQVPGASMALVPKVTVQDFARLLETPTRETVEYWMLRGERSVWPAVCALRMRCAVEFEIEKSYQRARSLKAGNLRRKASTNAASHLVSNILNSSETFSSSGISGSRDLHRSAVGDE